MEKDKNDKNIQNQRTKTTNEKLDSMRLYVQDKENCKIIAKKLMQYISQQS